MKIKNNFKKIFYVLVFVLTLSFTNNVFADTISYYYGNTKINGIFPSYYTPGEELDLPIGEQVAPIVGEHGRFIIDNLYDNPELTGNPITKILATDSGDKTFYMEGHYNVTCVYVKKYSSETLSNSECVRIGDNYNLGINNVNKADQIDPMTSVHFRNYYNEHYAHVKIHYEKNGWDVYDATYHRLIQHYNDGESFVVPNYDIEIKPSYIETRVSPEFEEVVGTYGWISTSYKAQPEFDPNYPTNYVSNYLVNSYTGTSDITVEPIYQVNQICHYMIEGEYEYFHEVPCGTIITLPVNDTATTYGYGYHEFHNADNSPDYVSDTYLKTENVANGWRVSNQGYYYDGDQVAILKDNTLISKYTRTIRHTLYDAPEIDDPHFIEWRVKQSNTWFEYTEHDVLNVYQDIYPLYDYPTSKISFYSTYTDNQGLHLNPLYVYRFYTLDVDSMKLTNNLNYFENETNQVSYYPALGFYLPNVSQINKDYRFVEFYDNPEFTGDPITYIEPNENGGDITLYVKEVHNNTLNRLYPDKHVTVTFHSHIANGWPADGFRDYTEEEYYLKSEDGYAHVTINNDHFAYSWQSGVGNYVRLNYHVGDEIVDTERVDFTFYDPAKEGDQSNIVYQWRDADGNIYNRSNYNNLHDNIYLFDHDIDLYSIDFDYDNYLPIASIVEADWLDRSISWDWTRTYPCDAPDGMICYWSDEPNGDPIIKSNALFYNNSYLKRNYSEMHEDNIFDFITMKFQRERQLSDIDLYAVYVVPTEHSVTLPYVVDVAYEEVPYELPGHNIPKASEVVATLTAEEYSANYLDVELDENGRYISNVVRKYNPFGWRIEGTDYVYPFESEINVNDDITLVPEYTGSIQPAYMPAKKSLQNVRFDLTLTDRRLNDYVLNNAYYGQEDAEVYVENVEQKINFDYGLEGDEEHYEYWEGPYGSINLANLYKIGAIYNSPDLVAFEIYVNDVLVDTEESEVYQDEDSSDYEQFYYISSSKYDSSHVENDYNITVKAVYDEDINTYTIKDTTGLYFDTIEYTELSDDIVIPNPMKVGYIFTGWTFNYNCRTGIGECNSSISSLVKNVTIAKGSAKIFSNIQLTPNFESNQVTVTKYDNHNNSTIEVYDYGYEYNLGVNDYTYSNVLYDAKVTFVHADQTEESGYVAIGNKANGWLVDSAHYDNNKVITLVNDITIRPDKTEVRTSPEFPATQNGYGWYTESGEKLIGYTGIKDITLYEMPANETYEIIFGVETDGPRDATNPDFSTLTYSKNNLHYGDTFQVPSLNEYPEEDFCFTHCYKNKYNTWWLTNFFSEDEGWKPELYLHYMDDDDTVKDASKDTLYLQTKKKKLRLYYEEYDSSHRLINTVDRYLEYGGTYTFDYNRNLYDVGLQEDGGTNSYTRVNIHRVGEPMGVVVEIPEHYNPGYETNDVEIPEGYEFDGWYTEPNGQGEKYSYEAFKYKYLDKATVTDIYYSTVDDLEDRIIKDYDTTNFTGFEPIHLYAHYEPKQTTTHTVTYPNGDTYEVEHGQTHTLLSNNESKASENIATVTFKYSNNRLPDATSYVQKTYMPNGWLIGDTNYADGTDIVVNEDIVLVPDFVETTIGATFPEVVDNDYYKSEWRTRSYCGGGSLVTSYNGTSNITYYESYKRVLHFDEDNGTPIYTKTFCENDYLLCSDALGYAEKNGAYFLGWTLYIDDEEVAYYSADEFEANGGPGSELSFDSYYLYNNEGYALAKADYSLMSYYISYNLNGGTVSGNPRSYTIEDEITLNNPTKEGFVFAGWGGTGLTGTNNMTVTIPAGSTGSRSYTAYWSTNKTITLGTNDIDRPDEVLATVTFNPHNGGAITTSDVIKTYTPNGWLVNGKHYVDGETIIVPIGSIAVPNFVERIIPAIYPSNPTKDGYEFEGWYDDATEGNKVSAYSGNEDITLHARYTDNYAYLDVNFNFNQKLLDLVTSDEVKNFRKATLEEYNAVKDEFSNGNDITGSGSPKRVYMWKNGKDILYYSDADVIYFPEDSSEYFAYIPYLRVLDLSGLNTSKVINMTSMFERNENDFNNKYRFTEINLSNFDTHNVTNMSRMFYGQAYLKADLDLSNFDTHNVTNMSSMFHLNSKTVDISNFDTSNVTNMSGMFNKFHGDDVIGIENLDTSKVTNMSYMFSNSHFYNLDLSGWDVSNVTNMEYMFERAAYLVNVDVSTWDVSKVEKMTHMFYYDFNLNVLDLRSWDTSNVVYTAEMFARCSNLKTIYVSNKWNMDSVLYGLFMFDEDNSIVGEKGTTYDESNIDFDYAHIDDAPTNPGYLSERLYETPKYTITFDGGEYFPTTSRLVDAGTPIGTMPTYGAVYNNYGEITFGGWYTDQTYTTEVTPDFIPIGNIIYYAKPLCSLGYSGDVAPERPTEIVGLVTFEPHNGEPATTRFIYKDYYARDKWLVDGQIYHEYDNIVLYPNISIEPYYESEIQEVFFPTGLTYVGHNFLGWFTEEEGGTQLPSYNQEESITLHAHWERNGKNICTYSNGTIEECEAGKTYRVPTYKNEKTGKVREIINGYGAYENAVYNSFDIIVQKRINSYEIDGVLYYPGDNYVINGDTYITVDDYRSYVSTTYLDSYVDVEVDSEWFAGEEKYFLGWFTEPVGGEQILSYNEAEPIDVYAHYYDDPDDVVLLTFNGIQNSYEIKVLKGTEFTPYDEGEEYTSYFNLDYQDGRPLVPGYQRQYKKPTGFDVNGRVIDVGDTVVINEDTFITTLSDGYKSELSDFETPYKEGYIFKGWYDAPEDGNFANFNSEDFYVYTDTYYAQYAPYNPEEDVIVDFDGEKFVYPRGTVLTLPDDREKEGKYFYGDFYDGTDYVGCLEIETSYTLRNFTVNNVEYDIGANITLNEDTVIISNFDEVTNYNDYTLEQYPDLVYPNFPDFGLEDTFYGWFDKPTGGKQYYDASEFNYNDKVLYAIYIDDNQIPITVDGEVIIVNKGLGNLPNSKNKKSENIAEITFDYNKEGYTNETAYITKDYTFDHFTIDGEGNYMPNQEYNFTHSIVINSVYTESYNYPEIPTVTDESFQGWYTNKTGGDLVTSLEGITSDTTLYANWNNNKVTICVNDECNEVVAGSTHNLGQNTDAKASEIISTVTFNPKNGEENVTSNVTKQFMPNGWLVNGVHYDDNADITVDVYTTVIGDYIETVVPAEFPTDPTKDGYEFIGWYDDSLDGNKIESYAGDSDITLYAHWSLDLPQPGEEFTLPENTETKTKTIATVTFVYGNGSPNTTSKVTRSLIGNGWLVNGVHYNGGETIVYEEGMTIVEDYINGDIVPAVFPSNPTKQNATFAGWYDTNAEAGGNRYTEYSKTSDITLYARWQKTKPECTSFEPYTTGINNIQKADEVISTVTFVYHNGQANTTTNVLAAYSPNGWVNNGTHYGNEQTISKCTTEDVEPDYDVIIKNGKFPTDPTRVGYEFVGWFTKETGGEQVTVLRGNEDITLHAHWTSSYSIITTGLNQFYGSMSLKPGTRIALDKALSYHNISEENVETNLFATADIYNIAVEGLPTYVWYDNMDSATYYYSDAEVIFYARDDVYDETPFYESYWFIDLSGLNTSKTTSMRNLFEDSNVNSIRFGNIDTHNVTDMSNMFHHARNLEYFDLSGFDTSNVTDMTSMFAGMIYKEELDVSSFDTSNVTSMSGMFEYDKSLTRLDLSNFDTHNVTDMGVMFYTEDPSNLEKIYVSDKWDVSNVTNSHDMFTNAVNIVGQNGTTYDSNKIDKEYAIIDDAPEHPGYLSIRGEISHEENNQKDLLCKRAKIESQSEHTGYCSSNIAWCNENNISGEFSFGNINTTGDLQAGDALVCDVNGDGMFDDREERFYYVSDYYDTETKRFNSSIAALIWYNDYTSSNDTRMRGYITYDESENGVTTGYGGPTGLLEEYNYVVPAKISWGNVSLYKEDRYILPALENIASPTLFSYAGYTGRLLTVKEIEKACGINVTEKKNYSLPESCLFLFEHAMTSEDWYSGPYWIETPGDATSAILMQSGYLKFKDEISDSWNARPVIDVPKSKIEGAKVTHTIYYPDDTSDVVDDGVTYALRTNDSTKEDTSGVKVTFDYNDGITKPYVTSIKDTYVANGWLIDNTHYENGQIVVVNSDLTVEYDYITTKIGITFPSNPERVGYTFDGWFDENDVEYTSYNGDEDITLYAHWSVSTGPIVLPVNDASKEPTNYAVTFKYNNGSDDTTSNVVVSYTPNGWLLDGVHVADGTEVTLVETSELVRDYSKNITPATFPEDPTRTGYTFQGWFNSLYGGNKYTSYDREEDIILYAHWYEEGATRKITLGTNTDAKADEIISTVTFLPHNGDSATVSNVVKSYRPSGWIIDGVNYSDGATVEVPIGAIVEPYYIETISNASFPEDPTKDGYEFTGWYTSETGGSRVTVLRGTEDITLHAQYTNDYAYLVNGSEFNDRLSSASRFRKATEDEYDQAVEDGVISDYNLVSTDDSPKEVYVWYDNNEMLYYTTAKVIFMNEDSSSMFATSIVEYDLDEFNTSKVTDMSYMFAYNEDITSLDLSNFDTHNVTDMRGMFNGNYSLVILDVSNLDTHNVTDMSDMFNECSELTHIDLSSFDTSKVTDMSLMFSNMSYLEELDLSNFDTHNVTNMSGMFYYDTSLTDVNLSSFDTSNVEDMNNMFYYNRSLEELDLSSFDTHNVVYFSSMFEGDEYLRTIYASELWSTESDNNSYDVFYYTNNLVGQEGTIYDYDHTDSEYARIDKPSIGEPGYLTYKGFEKDFALLDEGYSINSKMSSLSSNPTTFRKATKNEYNAIKDSLTDDNIISLENSPKEAYLWQTGDDLLYYSDASTIYMNLSSETMFYYMETLENIDLSGLNTEHVMYMESLFYYCTNLRNVNLSSFNTSNVTDMDYMFYTTNLETLDLRMFDTSKVESMNSMFAYSNNLKNIDLSSFDTGNVTDMSYMFDGDESLTTVYVSDRWNTDSINHSDNMFEYAYSIVGQEGTTYDENHIDSEYAHVDGGPSNPGYLTYKEYTPITNPELNIYIVTLPDRIDLVYEGEEYLIPENDYSKDNENLYAVTFKYQDGKTEDEIRYISSKFTNNGWTIDDVHYDNGDTIVVTKDIVLNPDYTSEVIGVEFPSDPTRDNYTFEGWYNGDTKYTSYEGTEDIILTAKWTGIPIIVCDGNDCREEPYGTELDLGVNNRDKDDTVVSTVTFDYHFDDGSDNPYEYVMKQYTPNGWLVNGAHYDDNANITITENTNIQPDYLETIIPVNFPETVNRQGYIFKGWYTQATGGEKMTSYAGENSILVHAQYDKEKIIVEEPDGEHEYEYGDEYEFKAVPTKADENIAEVTFKPENGEEDTVSYVVKSYAAVDWVLNGTHYNAGDKITLTENIQPIPQYTETITGATFPVDPIKEHYVFDGWFNNDTKYTEYEGTEDITLTAEYSKEKITVTNPDGTEDEYEYGDEYEFKTVPTKDNENIAKVTFKPENGEEDIERYVQKAFTPYGWMVSGTHYDEGDTITLTENIQPEPYYIETVNGVEFPEDPEKENYDFVGWFNGETEYTSYQGEEDLILTAQWSSAGPDTITINTTNMVIVKGESKNVDITTDPINLNEYLTYTGYSDIITVSDEGEVTAVEVGETTITVSTTNKPEIEETINVKVIGDEITSDTLTVETRDLGRIIIGANENTTVEDFLAYINNDSEYLEVYDKDGEKVTDYETIITTGARVKLVVDEHEYDEVIVIIRGDIDEDGIVDVSDKLMIKRHILLFEQIEGYKLYAADLDYNDQATIEDMIDVSDNLTIAQYILGKIKSLNPELPYVDEDENNEEVGD